MERHIRRRYGCRLCHYVLLKSIESNCRSPIREGFDGGSSVSDSRGKSVKLISIGFSCCSESNVGVCDGIQRSLKNGEVGEGIDDQSEEYDHVLNVAARVLKLGDVVDEVCNHGILGDIHFLLNGEKNGDCVVCDLRIYNGLHQGGVIVGEGVDCCVLASDKGRKSCCTISEGVEVICDGRPDVDVLNGVVVMVDQAFLVVVSVFGVLGHGLGRGGGLLVVVS